MNAPDSRAPLAEPSVELVPVAAIHPSRTHIQALRRKRFNPDAITELAASLLKAGQLQPIVVRPQPAVMIEGRKYELVLGERRWLAAQQAGLAHLQASVRELDDAAVLEAQLIENLQREDLHPLEEAEGYRELMAAGDLKKEDLGERLGKSRSWVYSRLKLLDLQPPVREALEAGRLDVSRALVLARIGDPVHQVKALGDATQQDWTGKEYQYSVRELQDKLGERGFSVSLRTAPFDPADTTLFTTKVEKVNGKKAEWPEPLPACIGCEYRSGNNDPAAADPDVCTHRGCYERKVRAHGLALVARAEAAGGEVIRGEAAKKIAPGRGLEKDRLVGYVDLDAVCDFDEFPEAEPDAAQYGDDADDNPAYQAACAEWETRAQAWQPRTYRQLLAGKAYEMQLLDDGKRVRELVPFKQARELLKKAAAISLPAHIAAAPAKPQPRYDYRAEQEKQEERRRQAEARAEKERAWRVPVLAAIVAAKPKPKLTFDELRAVTEDFLNDWTVTQGLRAAGVKLPTLKTCTEEQYTRVLRIALAAIDVAQTDGPPEELLALAKACKVDVAKIKKQLAAEAASTKPSK